MAEPKYEVVWPLGRLAYRTLSFKPRIHDLNGKTICELSHLSFRMDELFPAVREVLKKQYPDIKSVEYSVFGNIHGSNEAEVIAALPDLLHKYKCDAVISGIGA